MLNYQRVIVLTIKPLFFLNYQTMEVVDLTDKWCYMTYKNDDPRKMLTWVGKKIGTPLGYNGIFGNNDIDVIWVGRCPALESLLPSLEKVSVEDYIPNSWMMWKNGHLPTPVKDNDLGLSENGVYPPSFSILSRNMRIKAWF